jgi:hypothetical protein
LFLIDHVYFKMIYGALSFAILAALGANAAPINSTTTTASAIAPAATTVPNFVYTGNVVNAASYEVDNSFQNYLEQMFKNFTVPTGSIHLGTNKTKEQLTAYEEDYAFQIYWDYDLILSDFALDDDYIIDRAPIIVCDGIDTCSYTVQLSSTTTHQTRMGSKLGVTVKAGGQVLGVGLDVSVAAEVSGDVTDTQAETETTTYQWTLKNGQSCEPVTAMFRMGMNAAGEGKIIVSNDYTDFNSNTAPNVTVITDPAQVPNFAHATANSDGTCSTYWIENGTLDFCASVYQYYGPDSHAVSDADKACFWKQSDAVARAFHVCQALEAAESGVRLDLGPDTLSGQPYIFKGCLPPP